MHQYSRRVWLTGSISLLCLVTTGPTQAQISPDATLGAESSVVTPSVPINRLPSDRIDGGAIRGTNLFHSFLEFNVKGGQRAYFANPTGIENILSRVTGGNPSKILGTLGVLGEANLFLINPNGIIFGPNARLDVGGSFLASTASSLNLNDGTKFSSTTPEAPPLLRVSVPIGLQFGGTAGSVRVQASSLDVPPGKTLALVGGDVALEGGSLTATGGRIELGSVAGASLVSLTPADKGWRLGYEGIQNFQDIQLSQAAYVNANGAGGGDIQVQGRRVILTEGAGMEAVTLGSQPGGTLAVKASESVALIGTSADNEFSSSLLTGVNFTATGTGGNLTIETGQLIVRDGAQVLTSTSGSGDAGELTIRASSVELVGTSKNGVSSGLFTGVNSFIATGAGGNLTLETGQLIVRDGAQVSASTLGRGDAGNLTVRASSVELVGTSEKGSPSGLFTTAGERATGDGGNLTIETGQLLVRDGAQVAVTTSGAGNAGNLTVGASEVTLIGTAPSIVTDAGLPVISGLFAGTEPGSKGDGGNLTIDTSRLIVQDGAEAQTSTLGEGDAGNLIVTASESVELIGRTPDNQFPSGLLAVSGLEGVFTEAQGKGGDLSIETGQLIVRDRAGVTVSSTSTASDALGAGSLQVQARNIRLDNQAAITAETASGQGGDITLQVQDLLLLRRNSNISATAGTAQAGGNGGNIDIDTTFIVAIPSENSNITANAFTGNGGNIQIRAQSIFGIQSREEETPLLSEITASSRYGVNGVVEINTPEVDPSSGLVNLSAELVDVSRLIASGCGAAPQQGQSQFIVTGRGGLPSSPSETLSSDTVWSDLRMPTQQVEAMPNAEEASTQPHPTAGQLVEATGWLINNKGEVVLTASAPTLTPHIPWLRSHTCSGS